MGRKREVTALNMVIGRNLRLARQRLGLSQAQAAAACAEVLGSEWSRALWSKAEQAGDDPNGREFSASELVAFSIGLDRPLSWFLEPHGEDEGASVLVGNKRITTPDLPAIVGGEIDLPKQRREFKSAIGDLEKSYISMAITHDLMTREIERLRERAARVSALVTAGSAR